MWSQVATLYFNSSYQLPSASSEDFVEQLFLFQKNVMKLQLQMERCFSELAGDPACNPMRSRLQPDAIQPATRARRQHGPTDDRDLR